MRANNESLPMVRDRRVACCAKRAGGARLEMSTHSQHPELPIPHGFEDAVERVASGIERVIVLTSAEGEPRAALVSLLDLRRLDTADVLHDREEEEEDDRVGLKLREAGSDASDLEA